MLKSPQTFFICSAAAALTVAEAAICTENAECHNHGECIRRWFPHSFCKCDDGWTGEYCDEQTSATSAVKGLRTSVSDACSSCKSACPSQSVHNFATDWSQFSGNATDFCNAVAYTNSSNQNAFGCIGGPNADTGSYAPQQCNAMDCETPHQIYSFDSLGALTIKIDPLVRDTVDDTLSRPILTKNG